MMVLTVEVSVDVTAGGRQPQLVVFPPLSNTHHCTALQLVVNLVYHPMGLGVMLVCHPPVIVHLDGCVGVYGV